MAEAVSRVSGVGMLLVAPSDCLNRKDYDQN